jgi:hypothetical protein
MAAGDSGSTMGSRVTWPERILIVDDDMSSADSLKLMLHASGYSETRVAYSGAAALVIASDLQPGVVLVDLSLLDMTAISWRTPSRRRRRRCQAGRMQRRARGAARQTITGEPNRPLVRRPHRIRNAPDSEKRGASAPRFLPGVLLRFCTAQWLNAFLAGINQVPGYGHGFDKGYRIRDSLRIPQQTFIVHE